MLSHSWADMHVPAGWAAGELLPPIEARRPTSSTLGAKIGWREGCLLDIVKPFGLQRRLWATGGECAGRPKLPESKAGKE